MTLKEAIKVISVLTAAYPQINISQETIEIYSKFLMDLPFEIGKAVVMDLINKSKYFPTISEIRQASANIVFDEIPGAEQAWSEVEENIHKIGYYGNPVFSHPLIEQTVNALGWTRLCLSDNIIADRAHFFRIYESYRNREVENSLQLGEVKAIKENIRRQIKGRELKQIASLSEVLRELEAVNGK